MPWSSNRSIQITAGHYICYPINETVFYDSGERGLLCYVRFCSEQKYVDFLAEIFKYSWYQSFTNPTQAIAEVLSSSMDRQYLSSHRCQRNRQKCDFIGREMLTAIPHKCGVEICEEIREQTVEPVKIKGPPISWFPSFCSTIPWIPSSLLNPPVRIPITIIITLRCKASKYSADNWQLEGRNRWAVLTTLVILWASDHMVSSVLTGWSGVGVVTVFGRCSMFIVQCSMLYALRSMFNLQCSMFNGHSANWEMIGHWPSELQQCMYTRDAKNIGSPLIPFLTSQPSWIGQKSRPLSSSFLFRASGKESHSQAGSATEKQPILLMNKGYGLSFLVVIVN